METISIDINHPHLYPDSTTVHIKGFLYANTLPQLDKTFQTVVSSVKKKMVLDLSETTYISSGGWGLIITFFKRAQDAGGNLVLAAMKPEVYDAFELLEYDKVIRSFPTVDSALKEGFSSPASQAK